MAVKFALLGTGDELVQGDIGDKNCRYIAQILTKDGYTVGQQLFASDDLEQLKLSLLFLLEYHDVILTIGGLGPTSDDKTRFAIADVVGQELIFNDASWERITERLTSLSLPVANSNRQQALFPANAEVIPNHYGTADGCKVLFNNKTIYMLPGPPMECKQMFDKDIYPQLKQHFMVENIFRQRWLLFGASESNIASLLEDITKDIDVGYRVDYPYLEYKISTQQKDPTALVETIEKHISPFLLCNPSLPASLYLKQLLQQRSVTLTIHDHATGGHLQTALLAPTTHKNITFDSNKSADIVISGLEQHWQNQSEPGNTTLIIKHKLNKKPVEVLFDIPYRPGRVIKYVVELICDEIIKLYFSPTDVQTKNSYS